MTNQALSSDSIAFDPTTITRPDPALLKYFFLASLMSGPLFPIVFLPLYFKYHTLKYAFDDDGISMSWGILFRKEIHLTYRRIQDIHLTRNFVQRWLNLATVAVQTASGKSGPEMSIDGILQAEELRDHLYLQMRGAQDEHQEPDTHKQDISPEDLNQEALDLLRDIRDKLLSNRQGN
jgi:uncharacterized protein